MINFGSKINAITFIYTTKLGFVTKTTNISTPKIDSLLQKTYKMALARLLLQNKLEKVWFFEKKNLLANISVEMILKRFFLFFSNAKIQFDAKNLFKDFVLLQRLYLLLNK